MANVAEIQNIYPDVQMTFFDRKDQGFLQTLKNESYRICRELISEKYISSVFRKFSNGYLINNPEGRRLGFIIWNIQYEPDSKITDTNETKYMYILLICSKATSEKVGRILLHAAESYCLHNNIDYIQLEPANEALITVYESYGYKKMTLRSRIYMIKDVKPILIKNRFTRKQKRTTPTDI